MPFSKKGSKKKYYKKKGPTVKSLAKAVKKIENDAELKQNDSDINYFHATDVAQIGCLNTSIEGTSYADRVGSEVACTSVQFRFIVIQDPLQLTPAVVRHVILWDKQPNKALPAFLDVFDFFNTTQITNAQYNHDNSERFKILHDKSISVHAQGYDGTNYIPQMFTYRKKIKLGRITKYNQGNTGTITDINSNSLIFMIFSTIPNADTHGPNVAVAYRVYYKDC